MRGGAVVVACALASLALPAHAFRCTVGETNPFVSVHWETRTVRLAVRAASSPTLPGDALDRIIKDSFSAWTRRTCSDVVFEFGPVVPDDPPIDEQCGDARLPEGQLAKTLGLADISQVVFVHDCWPHDPAVLALTTMTFGAEDGVIRHGIVEVNERSPTSPAGFVFAEVDSVEACRQAGDMYDLGAVLTHEAGHFIGLAHTDVVGTTAGDRPTMTAVVDPCDNEFRSLSADDVDALCFVYPARLGTRQCQPLPDQEVPYVVSSAFGCSTSGDPGLLALAIVALLARAVLARSCPAARSRR